MRCDRQLSNHPRNQTEQSQEKMAKKNGKPAIGDPIEKKQQSVQPEWKQKEMQTRKTDNRNVWHSTDWRTRKDYNRVIRTVRSSSR